MGMRPPADEDDEEPTTVAFGIAAVDDRLEDVDVSYPISAADLRAQVGDVDVPYDTRGHSMPLGEAIAECDQERFEDEQDLMNAIHPVFEHRRRQGASVVERVRRLFGL